MEGDALATEFAAVEFGGMVVADAADVVRTEAPALAGDESGGDLAAEKDLRVEISTLEPREGNWATWRTVSVAFSPMPRMSNFCERIGRSAG